MTDREKAAVQAGLKDMDMLRLYGDDVPIDVVLKDLKGRFGRHPSAFHQDPRGMTPAEYASAKGEMLANAARRQPGALPPVDARTLSRSDYQAARAALIRSLA